MYIGIVELDKDTIAIADANAIAPLLAEIVLYIGDSRKTEAEIAEHANLGIKFLREDINAFYSRLNGNPIDMFVNISNGEYALNDRGLKLVSGEPRRIIEEKIKAWKNANDEIVRTLFEKRRK
ncbi:MAG: hypothetical protein QXZ35_01520 [Candidatus Micrarchaeaceae archaeon]